MGDAIFFQATDDEHGRELWALRVGTDIDQDGIKDLRDNCPFETNPDQLDSDGNGKGDVCEFDIYLPFVVK